MALELFRVVPGLELQSDDFTSGMQIFQGFGPPATGSPIPVLHQTAPIGSVYFQSDAASDNLNVWWKFRDLNNDVTDWQVGASKEYVDNLISGGVSTGTAPVSVTTILDDTLLTSVATQVKWLLQIKDAGGNRAAYEIHALTDEAVVSYNTFSLLKVGGNIGGNIGLDIVVAGSPTAWEISLTPNAGAGTLTFTLKRVAFSFLA